MIICVATWFPNKFGMQTLINLQPMDLPTETSIWGSFHLVEVGDLDEGQR